MLTLPSTRLAGGLASAALGEVATGDAFRRSLLTVPPAWIFTVVGLADFVMIGILVPSNGVLDHGIGFMWAALSLAAPVFLLSHVFVIRALLRRRTALSGAVNGDGTELLR